MLTKKPNRRPLRRSSRSLHPSLLLWLLWLLWNLARSPLPLVRLSSLSRLRLRLHGC